MLQKCDVVRSMWTLCHHSHIVGEQPIPSPQALTWSGSLLCCYNSLFSSGKDLDSILECGCRDWCPFIHELISEVRDWCWLEEVWCALGIPICPEGVQWDEIRALFRQHKFLQPCLYLLMGLDLCVKGNFCDKGALLCWNRFQFLMGKS